MEILRVNMAERAAIREPLSLDYQGWGGRGLCAQIVNAEVPPTCSPLGEANRLVFATGLLAGLGLSSAGRLSIGAKSPLTGGIKESNAGGTAANKLRRLGIRALVVEGKPTTKALFVLHITREKAELIPANDLAGLGNYAVAKRLRATYGESISTISIGPTGEHCLASAGVAISDVDGEPGRFSARGGLGAVMGAKGLKAIVVDDQGGRAFEAAAFTREKFREAAKRYSQALLQNPVTSHVFPTYGTAHMVPLTQQLGCLPTRNFSSGAFERADDIAGEALRNLIISRGGKGKAGHPCMPGCLIRCSNVIPDENGEVIVSPLEYETLAMLGPNLGIGDLDAIARLNWYCNDLGVDTVEMGAALGVAMEAGLAAFGDAQGAMALLEEVREGTLLGRTLAHGAAVVGRVLGVTRTPVAKGQAFAAYDPRALKGLGVTYATSPMGADHTAGYTMYCEVKHHSPEGQVAASRDKQIASAAEDTVGICQFTGAAYAADPMIIVDLINAAYGADHDLGYLPRLGQEVLRLERSFNEAAGFTAAHDRLPEYIMTEKLPPYDVVFDVSDGELDKTFDFSGLGSTD